MSIKNNFIKTEKRGKQNKQKECSRIGVITFYSYVGDGKRKKYILM